jgi:hypothetical protein
VGQADLAVDLSSLQVQFEVTQSTTSTPNSAKIRVLNISEGTQQLMLSNAEGSKVALTVGYEGGPQGLIFQGSLIQLLSGRENALDSFIEIVAADGDQAYNFGIVNTSLAAGATAAARIKALASCLEQHGVTVGYIPDLSDTKSIRGVSMVGMAREYLTDLAAQYASYWSIQNGQLQFVPIAEVLPGEAIVLSSATGMIGVPEQTADGIHVRCLINPQLRVNGAIQIDNASINRAAYGTGVTAARDAGMLPSVAADGFYKALFITYKGDTRGADWFSDLICVGYDQGAPTALINEGKATAPAS